MNAAETIAAAIEKLQALKASATTGEWWSRDIDAVFAGTGLSDDVAVAYEVRLSADVALIVTLHRTIDAQLAILRTALAQPVMFFASYMEEYQAAALDLAAAIVGVES